MDITASFNRSPAGGYWVTAATHAIAATREEARHRLIEMVMGIAREIDTAWAHAHWMEGDLLACWRGPASLLPHDQPLSHVDLIIGRDDREPRLCDTRPIFLGGLDYLNTRSKEA